MKRSRSGSALIEFALVVPVFLLTCLGGVDLARVFNTAIKLTGATRTAMEYAGQNATTAADTTGITNMIKNGAGNPTGLSVNISQFCTCAIGGSNADCSTSCSTKLVYVQVTASLPFKPLAAWPGLPHTVNLTRTGTIRVAYPPPGGGGFGMILLF